MWCWVAFAGGGQTNGPGAQLPARPMPPAAPKKPRTDWQLGLSLAYDAELLEVNVFLHESPAVFSYSLLFQHLES